MMTEEKTVGWTRTLAVGSLLGLIALSIGLIIGGRFVYFYLIGQGGGHIQSLILAAVLMIVGFQTILIGVVADLVGANRKILEELLYRVRRLESDESRD